MRVLLRVVGWTVLGLLVLLLGVGAVVLFVSNAKLGRRYQIAVQPAIVPVGKDAVDRGHHIALTRGCLDCHGEDLGGAKVIDDGAMGQIYGANITQGRGGLNPNHRNEDWVRAIKHGIGSDGRPLVLMPAQEYAHFSDDDLGGLIAYLETAPKVDRASVPVHLGPIGRLLLVIGKAPLAAELIDHANVRATQVVPGVTVEYGRYLAIGCIGCHGPNYSGGKIEVGPPDWPPAANLTPHGSGELGKWSEADFIQTLRTARRPNGKELSPVMPRNFGQLNDVELKALWAFLQTLPPVPTGQR